MSTTTQLTQDLLAGVPEGRRVQYVRNWLKDFDKEVSAKRVMIAQFRQWLEQLSDQSITRSYQQHYNPIYLNLASVFGEELPFEKIHALTIDCIKTKLWDECEYYFHLSEVLDSVKSVRNEKEFATDQSLLRLKGLDSGLIRSLLSRGKGLIICSFRFGAIRYVPLELALLGFPILQVVNTPIFEAMHTAFASLGDDTDEEIPVADEMVQIHGGYGYLADFPAERAYRDSRINRIFEGTNEINRLLISSRLMNVAKRKRELTDERRLAKDELLNKAKKAALTCLDAAAQMNKLPLSEQQVIMLGIADIIIDAFAIESAMLHAKSSYHVDIMQVFCSDAIQRLEANVKTTLSATPESKELWALLPSPHQFPHLNTVAARERIAKALLMA